VKTGPYKPAPHISQGYYIAAEDRAKYVRALADAGRYDLATDIALSADLPSAEESTIKARMDMKANLQAYPDGAQLEAQQNEDLLRLAGLKHG
jgi:hypothetical protein